MSTWSFRSSYMMPMGAHVHIPALTHAFLLFPIPGLSQAPSLCVSIDQAETPSSPPYAFLCGFADHLHCFPSHCSSLLAFPVSHLRLYPLCMKEFCWGVACSFVYLFVCFSVGFPVAYSIFVFILPFFVKGILVLNRILV